MHAVTCGRRHRGGFDHRHRDSTANRIHKIGNIRAASIAYIRESQVKSDASSTLDTQVFSTVKIMYRCSPPSPALPPRIPIHYFGISCALILPIIVSPAPPSRHDTRNYTIASPSHEKKKTKLKSVQNAITAVFFTFFVINDSLINPFYFSTIFLPCLFNIVNTRDAILLSFQRCCISGRRRRRVDRAEVSRESLLMLRYEE